MVISLADWQFQVDTAATYRHTLQCSQDHCTCGYCKNYYEAAPLSYPEVPEFLSGFGVEFHGPSEVMPFLPTCVLACYRVQGRILKAGSGPLYAGEIPVLPEKADEESFFLWVGELLLPWLQEEDQEEVISPANLPEFMDRMEEIWFLRHGSDSVQNGMLS